MTPEEMNRAIEFLIQHSAQFSVQMEQFQLRQEEFAVRQDRDHEMLIRGLADLRESTGRFQVWATELLAIQSKRLDRHDRILDRLPPVQGPEGTPGH